MRNGLRNVLKITINYVPITRLSIRCLKLKLHNLRIEYLETKVILFAVNNTILQKQNK